MSSVSDVSKQPRTKAEKRKARRQKIREEKNKKRLGIEDGKGYVTDINPNILCGGHLPRDGPPSPKLGGWDHFRAIGSPRYLMAPMVDGSELPFRHLCRKYGVDCCYTPMLHSKIFLDDEVFRRDYFTTTKEDRPLIVQFCANDPTILLQAAKRVENYCDAVDINFGCPQHIAKRGRYGAFLQEEWDLSASMVETLNKNLSVPVWCKIRLIKSNDNPLLPDVEKSIEYAKMMVSAGCQVLAVHGRTRDQKGQNMGIADWSAIKKIREVLPIPVLANGNIRTKEDADLCMKETGVAGVLSACGLLENPALFSGKNILPIDLAREYMEACSLYPPPNSMIRSHLFQILKEELKLHTDIRQGLAEDSRTVASFGDYVNELFRRIQSGEGPPSEALVAEEQRKKLKAMKKGRREDDA
mmetsp:Transcript_50141/g.129051  ORF Transcript_50141/g.129051 Transcript_50141/m.129051 type:complete len:413 (-) Transcript_50141:459-1697(-)